MSRLQESALFAGITNERLTATVVQAFELADRVSRESPRIAPNFTDHAVDHFESLAELTTVILTQSELEDLTESEAFLLLMAILAHDLGMSAAGLPQLSAEWLGSVTPPTEAQIRQLHGDLASRISVERIPGLDRFLIADDSVRSAYAAMLGKIAASHSWPLAKLEEELGSLGDLSFAPFGQADVGFIACILRVVDAADITSARANIIQYRMRVPLTKASENHWLAQMNIPLPLRAGPLLQYNSTQPIASAEAWFQFLHLARAAQYEITQVRRYLDYRTISAGRFSLAGVLGVEDPAIFARYVSPPEGVIPVDVKVTASSMEKIVRLLGGRALYKDNTFAAIRELIQNARDAIYVRVAVDDDFTIGNGKIILEYNRDSGLISVRDNGCGMSQYVISNHLLSAWSSFWDSEEVRLDRRLAGVRHAGRFGIGFLSVFMLADEVKVTTKQPNSDGFELAMVSADRQGTLSRVFSKNGTTVQLKLREDLREQAGKIHWEDFVKSMIPALDIPIEFVGRESEWRLRPRWWANAPLDELFTFCNIPPLPLEHHQAAVWQTTEGLALPERLHFFEPFEGVEWPGEPPIVKSDLGFLVFDRRFTKLSICSHGIHVDVRGDNIGGLIEVGELEIDLARDGSSDINNEERWGTLLEKSGADAIFEQLRKQVIIKLNELSRFPLAPGYQFLVARCFERFGIDTIAESSLRWFPVIVRPGDLRYLTWTEASELLRKVRRVFLVLGASTPIQAYTAAKMHPEFSFENDVLVPDYMTTFGIDYERKHDLQSEGVFVASGTYAEMRSDFKGISEDAHFLLLCEASLKLLERSALALDDCKCAFDTNGEHACIMIS